MYSNICLSPPSSLFVDINRRIFEYGNTCKRYIHFFFPWGVHRYVFKYMSLSSLTPVACHSPNICLSTPKKNPVAYLTTVSLQRLFTPKPKIQTPFFFPSFSRTQHTHTHTHTHTHAHTRTHTRTHTHTKCSNSL